MMRHVSVVPNEHGNDNISGWRPLFGRTPPPRIAERHDVVVDCGASLLQREMVAVATNRCTTLPVMVGQGGPPCSVPGMGHGAVRTRPRTAYVSRQALIGKMYGKKADGRKFSMSASQKNVRVSVLK